MSKRLRMLSQLWRHFTYLAVIVPRSVSQFVRSEVILYAGSNFGRIHIRQNGIQVDRSVWPRPIDRPGRTLE